MIEEIVIPESHWAENVRYPHPSKSLRQSWETRLRSNIREQPDPAVRFGEWLSAKEAGRRIGAFVTFIEQPYLSWAQAVERVLAADEKRLREQIAFEITNPDPD